MARKTIFDDVFRTICQKLPHLLIPVINEVFGTDYSEKDEVTQLRNEHFERNGELITDSLLQIQKHTYHIECQSRDDADMVIRMIEYDFSIAVENITVDDDGTFSVNFPESCVIYLRAGNSKSRISKLNVRFADGAVYPYKMNTLCIQDYSQEEIFKKQLLMFLPFYILRYENNLPTAKKEDSQKLQSLIEEYKTLFEQMEAYCSDTPGDFTDLYNLSIKIINHVVKSSSVKRRIADMGGKVLTLPSEKLRAEGRVEGLVEGRVEGREEGQDLLVKAVALIRTGKTTDDLLSLGYDRRTVDLAFSIK